MKEKLRSVCENKANRFRFPLTLGYSAKVKATESGVKLQMSIVLTSMPGLKHNLPRRHNVKGFGKQDGWPTRGPNGLNTVPHVSYVDRNVKCITQLLTAANLFMFTVIQTKRILLRSCKNKQRQSSK